MVIAVQHFPFDPSINNKKYHYKRFLIYKMENKENLLENEKDKKEERIKKPKEYNSDTTSFEGSDDFKSQ